MNRLVLFIAAIIMLTPARLAATNSQGGDDALYVEELTVKSGDYFEIPISFRNANTYSAFQCDILLPEGIDVEKDEDGEFCMSIEKDRLTSRHQITSAIIVDGGIRVACYANPTRDIKGNDGVLFYIKARAKKDFVGEAIVRFDEIKFSTAEGVEKELENIEAVVNVVAPVNVFVINDVIVTDSYTLRLPVELKNDSRIVSFDAELSLADGVSLSALEVDAARCGDSFSLTAIQNEGVINIRFASSNSDAVSGTEGTLFYMDLVLEHNAAGTKEIALKNISATVDDSSDIIIEDIKCTATFVINSYTLTYIVDGEVYETSTVGYGDIVTPAQEPIREGHTFSGWSEIPSTMPAHDVTVEGTFSVNSYTLTYIVDGEVYETSTVVYGDIVTPAQEPTKEGYTFSGWSEIPSTMPAHDVTVEGTFSVNSYIVTFMVDGEIYKSIVVEYGAEIELPSAPEKEGYVFVGWLDVPATMPAKDIVIEGVFEVDTTGVDEVMGESTEQQVLYDLHGHRIIGVKNLEKGIYILNGNKVLVK